MQMTIEQARDIVRQPDPSEQDLRTAEIVLTLSEGDQESIS